MRLHFVRPGSFLSLVLLGFSLVLLPLAGAFVSAVGTLRELATQTREALYVATGATESSRALCERAVDMERKARLFGVLGGASARGAFLEQYEELKVALGALRRLRLTEPARHDLDTIDAQARRIAQIVEGAGEHPEAVTAAVPEFRTVHRLAKNVLEQTNALTLEEAELLGTRVERARRLLTILARAAVPTAILVAVSLAFVIVRPVGRIDRAIRRLGDGDFSTEISVGGPKDLQELGKRLDWLRRRLVELEGEKRKLLAHVSHDLKTPLTAIREGTELLLEGVIGPVTVEQQEVAQIMHQNSIELQRLIEDLLDLSTASSRRSKPSDAGGLETVALGDLVDKVLAHQKPALLKKDVHVDVRVEDVALPARGGQLRAVMDNLIGNAVKFTPPGGTLGVIVASEGAHASIEVWDSGPGVPPAEKALIFEPFFQGSLLGTGSVKGSGLGLAIASEHVRGHGGRLELLESASGARFRVTLPLGAEGAKA